MRRIPTTSKCLKIVLDAGYHGFVGIEFEGKTFDEYAGIQATKRSRKEILQSLACNR